MPFFEVKKAPYKFLIGMFLLGMSVCTIHINSLINIFILVIVAARCSVRFGGRDKQQQKAYKCVWKIRIREKGNFPGLKIY